MDFDPATALIVVDMQNDFAHPEGSLYVNGAEEVIWQVNAMVISAMASGAMVVYTKDWHPETTAHFAKDGGIWPVHCMGDTWGSEFHQRLVVAGPTVKKGVGGEDGYSGFTVRHPVSGESLPTELASLVESRSRLVVVGLALDYCVKETALDGARLGHQVRVPRQATAAVNLEPDHGEKAMAALSVAGIEVV